MPAGIGATADALAVSRLRVGRGRGAADAHRRDDGQPTRRPGRAAGDLRGRVRRRRGHVRRRGPPPGRAVSADGAPEQPAHLARRLLQRRSGVVARHVLPVAQRLRLLLLRAAHGVGAERGGAGRLRRDARRHARGVRAAALAHDRRDDGVHRHDGRLADGARPAPGRDASPTKPITIRSPGCSTAAASTRRSPASSSAHAAASCRSAS